LGKGRTSPLALILFLICCVIIVLTKKNSFQYFYKNIKESFLYMSTIERTFFILSLIFIVAILLCVSRALLFPPHLYQEVDSLKCHIVFPKQHLILGSFRHIRWSSADLRLLPLQFSLAPYWLVTELPNKSSQMLFVIGLAAVAISLLKKIGRKKIASGFIILMAIFGSHGLGIQMGALMLDLIICYLFIASIDSLLERRFLLSAIEFSFFMWSKPFHPLQILLVIVIFLFFCYILKKIGINQLCWGYEDNINRDFFSKHIFKRMIIYICIISIFIGGPFIFKSIYNSGTPLFPFSPGIINVPHIDKTSNYWQSILLSSELTLSIKDNYGSGRGILDFIKHFWILAVPEEGVMNRYDYPLGLPYLIFLGPFLYFSLRTIRNKKLPILPLLAIVYWITWWVGSQQARFLFIPLILIFISVSTAINKPTKVFLFTLLLALGLNFISLFRAHYSYFHLPTTHILRQKDRGLIELNQKYYRSQRNDTVVLDYYDIAYADFPVKVVLSESSPGDSEYWLLRD